MLNEPFNFSSAEFPNVNSKDNNVRFTPEIGLLKKKKNDFGWTYLPFRVGGNQVFE